MSSDGDSTVFSLDELPEIMQERILAREDLLLEVYIRLYNLEPGRCEVDLTVPVDSRLRGRGADQAEVIVEEVTSGIVAALTEAVNLLVLGTGSLLRSGPIRQTQPEPVLESRVYLNGYRHQDAEVELAFPDPTPLQEAVEAGAMLESVMARASDVVRRSVNAVVRTEVASGKLWA